MTTASEIGRTLSRRTLVKSGLFGGLFVALSGVGLSLQHTKRAGATPEGLLVFDADEYAIMVAISDTLCPKRGTELPSASELGLPQQADALLALADYDIQRGFRIGLRMIEHPITGAVFGERVVPFTHLDLEGRTRTLTAFRESRVGVRRTVFAGISALVAAQYWSNPQTWTAIGYDGPPSVSGLREMYRDNLVDLTSLQTRSQAQGG